MPKQINIYEKAKRENYMGKSKTEVILRSCKYFLVIGTVVLCIFVMFVIFVNRCAEELGNFSILRLISVPIYPTILPDTHLPPETSQKYEIYIQVYTNIYKYMQICINLNKYIQIFLNV